MVKIWGYYSDFFKIAIKKIQNSSIAANRQREILFISVVLCIFGGYTPYSLTLF